VSEDPKSLPSIRVSKYFFIEGGSAELALRWELPLTRTPALAGWKAVEVVNAEATVAKRKASENFIWV
jgi:hypothetical protein